MLFLVSFFFFLVEDVVVVGFDASVVIIQLARVLERWIYTRVGRLAVGRLVANWLAAAILLQDVGKVIGRVVVRDDCLCCYNVGLKGNGCIL